jgi:ribosomal protein L23
MSWKLIQTEKAYNVQQQNTFIIANFDKNHKTNKIELGKFLKKKGLTVLKINSNNSYLKLKSRGAKRNKISQFRPKKWYVTLQNGQILSEETVKEF